MNTDTPRCECPENSTGGGLSDSWYTPEELKARVHPPGKCPGDYDMRRMRRGDRELWLCSACTFPSDVEVTHA